MSFWDPQWPRQLPPGAAVDIATLGGLGRRMPAPGTWGSAAGTLFFAVCMPAQTVAENLVASAVLACLAAGICGEAERRIGRQDPGEVILDEVVAMPLCFLGWRMIVPAGFLASLALLIAGFGLFRFFDIRKPGFINRLQGIPGGWGIVLDDTAAALATCATLHLAHAAWVLV